MKRFSILLFALGAACGGDVEVFDPSSTVDDEPVDTMPPVTVEDMGITQPVADDAGATPPPDATTPAAVEPDDCPHIQITSSGALNVRPQPNTSEAPVGQVFRGMVVRVLDEVVGEAIEGETKWFEIEAFDLRGFVTAQYATCTTEPVTELAPPDGFYLPLECDMVARISQGNNGSFSHSGRAQYAWDFAVGLGTPLTAIADGLVIHTYAGTAPGSACDGGGQSCVLYANHVVLLHGDDTTSTYRHLSRVDVEIGDFVPRGVPVGLSGQTGWSTGPHAHVQRMENCGSAFPPEESTCQSIPTTFRDVTINGGVPRTGDTVTSGNCIRP